ncbi:MAG: FAD:protein FMN transferase [Clostridium sp.]
MRIYRKAITIALILLMSLSIISCGNKNSKPITPLRKTNYFMGTVVTISLYDKQDENIINKAFDKVSEIENTVSINKTGTELDKVNDNAGISPVKVSDITYDIVKKGLYYSELTNGSFDVTIGNLVKLWSIGLPEAKLPIQTEINDAIKHVNYKNLVLNDEDKSIFLKEKGMMIDLGSIAKGYTADEISKVLKAEGVNSAIIDLGGNVLTLGEKSTNTPWVIGIQNPSESRGEIVGSVSIGQKSVVTSGVYERYLEVNGTRYHHLLSPSDGYPFDNEIAGVSIISDYSIDGDALSTSVFSMGVEKGLEFINSINNVDAIFVTKDNKIYLSNGAKEFFTLTNKDFTLAN